MYYLPDTINLYSLDMTEKWQSSSTNNFCRHDEFFSFSSYKKKN